MNCIPIVSWHAVKFSLLCNMFIHNIWIFRGLIFFSSSRLILFSFCNLLVPYPINVSERYCSNRILIKAVAVWCFLSKFDIDVVVLLQVCKYAGGLQAPVATITLKLCILSFCLLVTLESKYFIIKGGCTEYIPSYSTSYSIRVLLYSYAITHISIVAYKIFTWPFTRYPEVDPRGDKRISLMSV